MFIKRECYTLYFALLDFDDYQTGRSAFGSHLGPARIVDRRPGIAVGEDRGPDAGSAAYEVLVAGAGRPSARRARGCGRREKEKKKKKKNPPKKKKKKTKIFFFLGGPGLLACPSAGYKYVMSYYERNLPHWQPEGAALFLTWRLHGSLPRAVE